MAFWSCSHHLCLHEFNNCSTEPNTPNAAVVTKAHPQELQFNSTCPIQQIGNPKLALKYIIKHQFNQIITFNEPVRFLGLQETGGGATETRATAESTNPETLLKEFRVEQTIGCKLLNKEEERWSELEEDNGKRSAIEDKKETGFYAIV